MKKPQYAIESVDKALQLLILLQEREWVRIAEAAQELDVAPSTAHRLMATLVYRGFALQDEQRRYCSGPNMAADATQDVTRKLIAIARPHLEALAVATRETVNLVERVGGTARFLHSSEGPQLLRIGNRAGSVLPAHTSSGGKAALAALPEATVAQLYSGSASRKTGNRLSAEELKALQEELAQVRARGYALNLARTEPDLAAIGAALGPLACGRSLALSLSAPITRAAELQQPRVIADLVAACEAIRRDLNADAPE